MSNRAIASASGKRGAFRDTAAYEKLFSHLKFVGNGKYEIIPFKGIIRGDKHNSKLPHNVEVEIKNWDALADWAGVSTNNLKGFKGHKGILDLFPNGFFESKKPRGIADPHAAEYNTTICHQLLEKHYAKNGVWDSSGKDVDSFAQMLYLMFNRTDPAYLTLEQFEQARYDPRFFDATGDITYGNLGYIRKIMQFAAMVAPDSPLFNSHFQFSKTDKTWSTIGKKNIGGKKDTYLQPEEIPLYINGINDIETLVLFRLIFEGMSRVSSGCLMGKSNVDGKGYNCLMIESQYACLMYEPKVKKSKTGGKVKRYFTPDTIAFFKQYLIDYDIKGAWFPKSREYYTNKLKAAGFRAGLWRFKTAAKGQRLDEGEKLDLSVPMANNTFLVYRLEKYNNRKKNKVEYFKVYVVEGKVTSSHIVGKHTGVSIAGLHGFSLDNCAEQAGTEPSTIRDFYHGTLGVGLQKVVMGEQTYKRWIDYIHDDLHPLFMKRYNELKRFNAPVEDEAERTAAILGEDKEE